MIGFPEREGSCSVFVLWWVSSCVHQHSQRESAWFRAHYAESINFAFACVCSYLSPSPYPVVMTTLLYIAIAFKRKWEVQHWAITVAEMHRGHKIDGVWGRCGTCRCVQELAFSVYHENISTSLWKHSPVFLASGEMYIVSMCIN